MTDMVERVARAIAFADLDEQSRAVINMDANMMYVADHYVELARAAIEAMREPTDEMLWAARAVRYADEGSMEIWNGMIDAALAKPSE